MTSLLDQLIRAIEGSGQTRYRIAKETEMAQSQLSRLVKGGSQMSVASIERIADYLELEIVLRPKRGQKRKSKGR